MRLKPTILSTGAWRRGAKHGEGESMSDSDTAALAPLTVTATTATQLQPGVEYEVVEDAALSMDSVARTDDEETSAAARLLLSGRASDASDTPRLDDDCVQLDLVNFTLVRCEEGPTSDGRPQYRLMATDHTEGGGSDRLLTGEVCVLDDQGEERGHEVGGGVEYVRMVTAEGRPGEGGGEARGPLLIMEYSEEPQAEEPDTSATLLAQVIHNKLVSRQSTTKRRRSALPSPHEMLSSPNFKLYVYSCRQCSFRCNAIKDLTEHKKVAHVGRAGGRWKGSAASRVPPPALQCARCPHRAATHAHLVQHQESAHPDMKADHLATTVQDANSTLTSSSHSESKDSDAAELLEILVCGACGFEAKDRNLFKKHIMKHKRTGK